jgi:hypothetical protein
MTAKNLAKYLSPQKVASAAQFRPLRHPRLAASAVGGVSATMPGTWFRSGCGIPVTRINHGIVRLVVTVFAQNRVPFDALLMLWQSWSDDAGPTYSKTDAQQTKKKGEKNVITQAPYFIQVFLCDKNYPLKERFRRQSGIIGQTTGFSCRLSCIFNT